MDMVRRFVGNCIGATGEVQARELATLLKYWPEDVRKMVELRVIGLNKEVANAYMAGYSAGDVECQLDAQRARASLARKARSSKKAGSQPAKPNSEPKG